MMVLAFGRAGGGFLVLRQFPGNIAQESGNQNQGRGYLSKSINIPKIHFSNFLSSQTVSSKNSIPRAMFIVKIKKSWSVLGKEMLDPINGAMNQAAEILIDSPESALNQGRYCLRRLLRIN